VNLVQEHDVSIPSETKEAIAHPEREDRFRFDVFSSDMHFPCAVCSFREQPRKEACTGCRYYFN
jgi:hypothetical protein